MKLKLIFALAMLFGVSVAAFAVTDREMEQARVITAKNYLRYANNGSGYLDEIKENPATMAELKKVLKAKELENLKAFEQIPVAKDYASWDKAKMVEYWSVTVLGSPKLITEGKASKSRTVKNLNAMTVAAPAPAAPAPSAAVAQEPEAPLAKAEAAQAAAPADEAVVPAAVDSAAAEASVAKDEEITEELEDERPRKKNNATWIYVGILIFLVIVVVVLVIYASRSMKGSQSDPDDSDDLDPSALKPEREGREEVYVAPTDSVDRKEHEFMVERKNEKIRKVKAELDVVREENARLQAANTALQTRLDQAQTQIESLRIALAETEKRASAPAATAEPADAPQAPRPVRSLYLGRVNRDGLFVRADRQINPDATVYRLDTEDGYTGTFRVVSSPEVADRLLESPERWLSGGCTARDLYDTDGYTDIVTESAGTAVLESGCWKMIRKAKIKYS